MPTEEVNIEIKEEPLLDSEPIDTKPQIETIINCKPFMKYSEEFYFVKSENLDVKCEGEEEELDDPLHFELENCQNSNGVALVQNQPSVRLRRLNTDLLKQLDDNLLVDLNSTSEEFINTEEIALPNKRFSKKRQLDEEHKGRVYKCSYCNYSCKRKEQLKSHSLIHSEDKPYQCLQCDYSCKRKGYLNRHLLIHSEDKPYQCLQCDYSFKRKRDLKSHSLIHSEEKPYQCPQCDYSCIKKSDLKRHLHIHSEEKPYQCQQCDYSGKQKHNLKSHSLIHSAEKPYQCPQCDHSCKQKRHLKRHLLIHCEK